MALSQELLDILVCPQCKGDLDLVKGGAGLACKPCRLVYPVRDDVPVMLIDEATTLGEE